VAESKSKDIKSQLDIEQSMKETKIDENK